MAWEVEYTDQFEAWWNTLGAAEQEEVEAKVELLEEFGPVLPRPHADVIVTSKHANMKELRADVVQKNRQQKLRVLYAFDPRWKAILLIGGDKTGNPNWYKQYVPIADKLFADHLEQIKREQEEEERKHGKKL